MKEYIFTKRNGIHIIDLKGTVRGLIRAYNFLQRLCGDGKTVLFVGTKRSAREAIQGEAARCGMPYVNQRWLGGMLTNFKTIRQSIKRLQEIEDLRDSGALDRRSKKEAQMMRRELDKLLRSLGGIKDMSGLPDALFVVGAAVVVLAATLALRLRQPKGLR